LGLVPAFGMKKILVFQHADVERLGTLEKEIQLAGMTCDILLTYQASDFPTPKELESYGAVISLGGEKSVYERHKHPWLDKEFRLLQEALRMKKPILGICLGAQMLAGAAGAAVRKGPSKEIGWGWVRFDDWFSQRHPLTFQLELDKPHVVFHWHGDSFDLPVEGYRLAWNDATPIQMFCIQGNAVGIQFHPEMTGEMIGEWVVHHRKELVEDRIDPDKILQETPKYLPDLQKLSHRFFYGFASLVRENVRQPR